MALSCFSDQEIPIQEALQSDLFGTANLEEGHPGQRKTPSRCPSGSSMTFAGSLDWYSAAIPGARKKTGISRFSTGLLFQVFHDYDPDNLLFQQAYDEAMYFQLEKIRLRQALDRIASQRPVISRPGKFTPFALPIVADSLREKLTSEKLEQRIERMKLALLQD